MKYKIRNMNSFTILVSCLPFQVAARALFPHKLSRSDNPNLYTILNAKQQLILTQNKTQTFPVEQAKSLHNSKQQLILGSRLGGNVFQIKFFRPIQYICLKIATFPSYHKPKSPKYFQ